MRTRKDNKDDVTTIISFQRATDTRHGDEETDKDDDMIFAQSPYVQAMMPLMASLKLFGLFFHKPARNTLMSSLPACDMMYCVSVTCLVTANVAFVTSALRQVE